MISDQKISEGHLIWLAYHNQVVPCTLYWFKSTPNVLTLWTSLSAVRERPLNLITHSLTPNVLTYQGPNETAEIFQITFSDISYWKKNFELSFKFHWSLFKRDWQKVNIGSGNGLVLKRHHLVQKRHQVITKLMMMQVSDVIWHH